MKPSIAVDIVARDKTEAGRKAAERSFGGFARKTAATAREGGFEKLGKQVESLTRFRTLSFGFDSAGRSIASVGSISRGVTEQVGGLTRSILGAGVAGRGAMGAIAESAATATGAVFGLAAAVVAIGVGTYALGDKWAKIGADVGKTAKDLGVSDQALQRRRGAAERFGVSSDQVDAGYEGLGSTLYDAKYGANNLALGALTQLGVKMKEGPDGQIDVDAMMDDIADGIARQKDPLVQRKLASIFGVSGMLPALRKGSGTLKAEGDDFMKTGAAFTPGEVAKSEEVRRKSVRLRQQLSAIEKSAGVAAEGATGYAADKGVAMARGLGQAAGEIKDSSVSLAHSGRQAGDDLVAGAKRAAAALNNTYEGHGRPRGGFDAFARRIERKESAGGHQFEWRRGRGHGPLTSSAGAIGAMQMLPETAKRAAAYAGVKWDENRFRNDKGYNEQLGRAELQRLLAMFGGSEVLAAAAYNAGPGVLKGPYKDRKGRTHSGWLDRFGDPSKGEISEAEFASKIPFPETRDYVAKTAMAGAAKAEVTINVKGLPAGSSATVKGGQDVNVALNVARSLDMP